MCLTSRDYPQSLTIMGFLTIQRKCHECETTRALIQELRNELATYRSEMDAFRLDYENLYDKVRTNLAKLARRESRSESPVTPEQEAMKGTIASQRLLALRRR